MIKSDPGELVDRQTVLELKIEHSNVEFEPDKTEFVTGKKSRVMTRTVVNKEALGTRVHVFFDELELITNKLRDSWVPSIWDDQVKLDKYDELYNQLSEVNAKLWDLEDQARVLRAAPDKFKDQAAKQAAEVLFSITDLNEERAKIVKEINSLWGLQSQEKSY